MSPTTDVLILTSSVEKSAEHPRIVRCLEKLNLWLEDHNQAPLREVSDLAGGSKPMDSLVFGGAFLFLDREAFLQCIRELPWCEPENVQVLIREQEMPRFAVFTRFID